MTIGRPRLTREQFEQSLEMRYPGITERLGTEADKTVGEDYGLTKQRVHQFRVRLGIKSNRTYTKRSAE
tara:strand:- start:302 stop:508 length:207 start_codon:yes stop_codon:yes gene_type:complete